MKSSSSRDDAHITLLERLAEACGTDLSSDGPALAVDRAALELPGDGDALWQERLQASIRGMNLQAQEAQLSVAEVAGTLRPGQPAVTFRRTEDNPGGWVLLLDRRWGRVFCPDLGDARSGRWVASDELAAILDVDNGQRLNWLFCDPGPKPVDSGDGHHPPSTTPLRRLIELSRPERGDLWSIVVFGVLVGALTLATPVAVQQLVNSVALGGLIQPVVVLALLLFAGLAFSAALSALQAYVAEIVQRRLFVRVAADLAHRLPRVQIEAFDRRYGPELVNRFFDVVTVQKTGTTLLLDGVGLLLQTVIGLLVLSFYHPLILGFSIVLLTGIAVVVFVFGRGAVPTAIAESRAKYEVAGWLEEMARHDSALKTVGAAAFAADRADALTREYLRARRTHYRVVFRQLAGALGLQVVASSALLGLGGGLVIVGQLTLGQLVASELIVTAIVASFAKLGKHLEGYYDLLAAVDKLGHLFELPLERADGVVHRDVDGPAALGFHDVSFRFGDSSVLSEISFEIAAGERIGLVGDGGAGKSTLIDLALGLRTPCSGYVTLDRVDLRDLRLESVRESIARVRRGEIIDGTVEENVRMGRAHITSTAVRDALQAVGLLDDIRRLPRSLGTRLVTGGKPLSEGQALRLALARAIAGRPRLILLDDTLSDLDERSRLVVLDALFAPGAPWTLVVVSANPETNARCQRLIQLTPSRQASLPAPPEAT